MSRYEDAIKGALDEVSESVLTEGDGARTIYALVLILVELRLLREQLGNHWSSVP